MTVIAELDNLIQLVESQIPANPNSPANRKLRKRLEGELVRYFSRLKSAFPYHRLDKIYNRYIKESLESDARDMLDPLLATFSGKLKTDVSERLAEIYYSGSAEMITWGKTKGGVPIAYEGPPISEAIDWAEKQGARLVTQMDDETRRRLAKVISDGIKNKRGIPGLARDLRKSFDNMSKYRSRLISQTETTQALFQASQDRMEDMGIEGKEWILGSGGEQGNCPQCQANAAVGVIPVNSSFPTPQDSIHPGCTCAIAPARLKR